MWRNNIPFRAQDELWCCKSTKCFVTWIKRQKILRRTCLRVPIPVVKRLWCGASAGVKWGLRGRAGYSDRNSVERCRTAPARAPLPRSRTALAQRMSATSRSSFVLSRFDRLNLELGTQSRFVSWIVIAVPKSERKISWNAFIQLALKLLLCFIMNTERW